MGLLGWGKNEMAPITDHLAARKPTVAPLELDKMPALHVPTADVVPAAVPTVTQPVKPQAGGVVVDLDKHLAKLARKVKAAKRRIVKDLIDLGAVIVEARDLLADHSGGSCGKWCKQCGMSRMSAHRYAAAFDAFGSCNSELQRNFDAQAIRLLSSSHSTQPAIDESLELAEEGEHVDALVAKQLIKKHTDAKPKKKRIEPTIISTAFGSVAIRCKPGSSVRNLIAAVLKQLMDAEKKAA